MPLSVHHVTLTVTDVDRSADWYQRLLGQAQAIRREGDGWVRVRMEWPGGLVIGVTRHDDAAPQDRFDHRRSGLDHLGLRCESEAEVRSWAARLDELGIAHGPVEDVPYGWAITSRDPDDIPIEFFASR